jgi:hypothetical protein
MAYRTIGAISGHFPTALEREVRAAVHAEEDAQYDAQQARVAALTAQQAADAAAYGVSACPTCSRQRVGQPHDAECPSCAHSRSRGEQWIVDERDGSGDWYSERRLRQLAGDEDADGAWARAQFVRFFGAAR